MLMIFKPLLPSPIYGVCNGYWMELDLDEVIQRSMYLGEYEPEQTEWVKDILKPGGKFLDVGANVGYYTTLAASLVGGNGQVVAFEPSPYAYAKLKTVLKDSKINQVRLFQSAAGDENGQLNLYLPIEKYLHSPSLVQSDKSYIPVKVDVFRLESHHALQGLKGIDLMKLDVEGFEPNVLRGMRTYLQSGRVKYLMCELNSGWLEANGSSCENLFEMIKDLGFVVRKETKQATIVAPGGLVYRYQDILFQHV